MVKRQPGSRRRRQGVPAAVPEGSHQLTQACPWCQTGVRIVTWHELEALVDEQADRSPPRFVRSFRGQYWWCPACFVGGYYVAL